MSLKESHFPSSAQEENAAAVTPTKYVPNGPDSVVGGLALAILQKNYERNRPLSIPSLNLVLAGKEPPELYASSLQENLKRQSIENASNPKLAALDSRVTLRQDISPATRWLLSYADEEAIRKFIEPLRIELTDFSKNKGVLYRIQIEIAKCLEDAEFSPESSAWYQERADLINRIIGEPTELFSSNWYALLGSAYIESPNIVGKRLPEHDSSVILDGKLSPCVRYLVHFASFEGLANTFYGMEESLKLYIDDELNRLPSTPYYESRKEIIREQLKYVSSSNLRRARVSSYS